MELKSCLRPLRMTLRRRCTCLAADPQAAARDQQSPLSWSLIQGRHIRPISTSHSLREKAISRDGRWRQKPDAATRLKQQRPLGLGVSCGDPRRRNFSLDAIFDPSDPSQPVSAAFHVPDPAVRPNIHLLHVAGQCACQRASGDEISGRAPSASVPEREERQGPGRRVGRQRTTAYPISVPAAAGPPSTLLPRPSSGPGFVAALEPAFGSS